MSDPKRTLQGCEVLPRLVPKQQPQAIKRSKAPGAGRFETLNAFVDASMKDVGGTAAKVWLIIFRDTKPNGLACVSDADMARRAGVSTRSIGSARAQLRRLGLLQVVRRGGLGRGASVYRVRSLVAEAGCALQQADSRDAPRQLASSIPERDQNGHPDPCGSGALRERARVDRGGGA